MTDRFLKSVSIPMFGHFDKNQRQKESLLKLTSNIFIYFKETFVTK